MGPKKRGPKKRGPKKRKLKKKAEAEGPKSEDWIAQIDTIMVARNKEIQDRNFMMLERDKVLSFLEVKKEEYDKLVVEFRLKDRAMEELEEQHQKELKVYNQKNKYLLYEQQHMLATMKADNEQALKLQREAFSKHEGELVNDKRALKDRMKEMELSYEETIRSFKLEHAKEFTKMRQEYDHNAKELEQKFDNKVKELREGMDLCRKTEIEEIEERKNVHVLELTKKHKQTFVEIKSYYNDITHNNLDMIKTLKEEVTSMKKKEAANEKLMYDITQENKKLTEALSKALKEVEKLRLDLINYEKDKHLVAQMRSCLAEKRKQFKQLEWDYQILQRRSEQLQAERDEIFAKFEGSIYNVQQKCGLTSMLLQRKVQILGEELEKKELQLEQKGVKLEPDFRIEFNIETKNNLIKSLQYDLGKVTKAHEDVIRAFETKMAEYGIPLEEMGLPHYISNSISHSVI